MECDLPGIIWEKWQVLAQILGQNGNRHPNLRASEVNVLHKFDLMQALQQLPAAPSPVIICNEGLLPYFNRDEELPAAASNIREVFCNRPGFWITTDLAVFSSNTGAQRAKLRGKVVTSTGRNVTKNLFRDSAEVDSFIAARRFKTVHCWNMAELAGTLSTMPSSEQDRDNVRQEIIANMVHVLRPI